MLMMEVIIERDAGHRVGVGCKMRLVRDGKLLEFHSMDDEGINNYILVTQKAGELGVQHKIAFKLKSNLTSKSSWNKRALNWYIRNIEKGAI